MSETEEDLENRTIEPGLLSAEVASDTQSILDRIKERRDSHADEITIDIPSWGGDLVARYQLLERGEIEKMARVAAQRARGGSNGSAAGVEADCDFLNKACIGVYARDPDRPLFGTGAPLLDVEDDGLIKIADGYDLSLVEMLKPKFPKGHPLEGEPVPIRNERELIVYLVRWNGVALAAHGQVVARWMQTTKKPIEDPQ